MKRTFDIARTAEGLFHFNTVSQAVPHITDVKLVAAYVLGTHEVVRNWLTDWRGDRGGVEFNPRSLPKKDPNDAKEPWVSDPWTITRESKLRLRLDLTAVAPSAGPERFQLTARLDRLTFEQTVSIRGSANHIEIESRERLPVWCQPFVRDIEVTLIHETDPSVRFDLATVRLAGAVTFDVPQDGYSQDVGLTWRRTLEATKRIRDIGITDVHGIAKAMVGIVPAYTLSPSSTVPEVLKHPRYNVLSLGGAWNVLDYLAERAECQAIIRLAYALMRQVGCPGDYARFNVWAQMKAGRAEFLEKEGPYGGADNVTTAGPFTLLMAAPLEVGKRYKSAESGANRFEACLRVETPNKTRYYGGGMPNTELDTPEAVVKYAFWGLGEGVWLEEEGRSTDEDRPFVFRRVLQRWRP